MFLHVRKRVLGERVEKSTNLILIGKRAYLVITFTFNKETFKACYSIQLNISISIKIEFIEFRNNS